MKSLSRRTFRCGCEHEADRDANAAVNLHRYPEEPGNRVREGATRADIGDQAAARAARPVPVVEARILASQGSDP